MNLAPWLAEAWNPLAARLAGGRLPHALLVSGAAGLGKRSLVDAFARALLCTTRSAGEQACGQCRACRLLAAGSHPDRITVGLEARDDGKLRSEIVVEQIRALSQRLALSSQFGGRQVAVIDPADAMNTSTANALLKTLEEPTASTLILLVADRPSRLPATIRSRCQRIDVQTPPRAQAAAWLQQQGLAPAKAEAALTAMLGNPGKALEAASGDALELRAACTRDLIELRRGGRALATADAWVADRPAERLWHAAVIVRDEACQLSRGVRGPLGLTDPGEIPKLAAWFAAANRAREQLDTPLRSELVMLDLLHGWPSPRRT